VIPAPARLVVETHSPNHTEALGRRLGGHLRAGDVVALVGPLGSGKTVLARGIALGAGATGYIASPSFVVIREYAGPLRVYHVDLYRLEHPDEIDNLGLEELMDGRGLMLVEWADRAAGVLPRDYLGVACAFGAAATDRVLTLTAPASMADRLSGIGDG
jgi:tRNA threonylcarbamoyladenosine biosynthesis protein TsaE